MVTWNQESAKPVPAGSRGGWLPLLFAMLVGAAAVLPVVMVELSAQNTVFIITNVDSADPVASGQQLTYTITVKNSGGAKVNNVVLSDQVNGVGGIGVPPELSLTSSRGSCVQNGNLVTCNAGTIEGFGTWTVTIRGIVTAANGTTLNNTATVTGTKSAQNHSATATATTLVSNGGGSPLPDLTIAKIGPTSVPINTAMVYTLTINNIGTANATDIKVVDTVPAGVTILSAAGTSLFTCGVAAQTVTCIGGAVNQGSNATITINATSPIATGTITNTASVDPDSAIPEANELNNTSALVNTQVTAGPTPPALFIDKTDDPMVIPGAGPDPVNPGAIITYKILLRNDATTRADDPLIVDGTQGLEAASITVNQVVTNGAVGPHGGCVVTAPEVRCSIRSLDPGGTILMTITGKVVASAGSTIFNTATGTANVLNQGLSATDTEITTVKPGVDLTITKGDTPDPVCARSWPLDQPPAMPTVCRGGLRYNFVVGNSGIATATNVVVRDQLPPDTVFDRVIPAAIPCAVTPGNVLTCTLASVGPETTLPFSIIVVAPASTGPILNTVTVDPANAIFEADETNNTATQMTQVATGIDLTILKEDKAPGFDPIATRGTQTYTITVDNIGTQDATNIHVRDVLPANTIFRSASGDNGFTCSHSNGVVDCVGGSLLGTASEFYDAFDDPGDDTAIIIIRIFAQPNVGTGVSGMHNEVRVDPFNAIPEANETNNIDIEDTDVSPGGAGSGAFNQLTIDKVQKSPANPVARNAVVTYEITIGNDATDPAVNVTVRDFIPAGSRYIEATGDHEFDCTEQAQFIQCTGGNIAPAGTAKITLKIFAPDTPGTYTNQAIVDPLNAIDEGNEFDNQDSETTVVENGGNGAFNDLRIEKSGPSTVTPGGEITYTLQVTNAGSDPALNVSAMDILPVGTTFISAEDTAPATPGAFTCSHAGGTVTCTGATINGDGGAGRNIEIKVKAPNLITVLTNQAFVDPENEIPEGDEENNTDTFDTSVVSVINLKITKTGPEKATQSQVKDYVIKVKNEKPSSGGSQGQTAFGVQMHDPLPVGVIPLAVDAGQSNNWACQILENPINVVDCEGDLNPDQEVTITITVFITAENNRSLDNEACVDPEDEIVEFNPPGETDNCSTATTPLVPDPKMAPDLQVTKTASTTTATPGDQVTYTIKVENIGTAKAKSPLTLTDDLPDQVSFVSVNATSGWTCAEASGVVTCNDNPGDGLDVGASTEITLVIMVDATATLPVSNTAVAALALVDPAPSDTFENETSVDNNDSTVVVSLTGPGFDLAITDIVDTPDPAIRGGQLSYTVVAVNGGSLTANNAVVSIDVPTSGVTFLNAAGSNGFNCGVPVSGTVSCTGNLAGGGSTVITLNFLVHLTASDNLNLTAEIDRAGTFTEGNETNNSQSEVTTVSGDGCSGTPVCIDLAAAQPQASPDPLTSGNQATFSVLIVNTGAVSTADSEANSVAETVWFDLFGDVTEVVPTSSNPSFSCAGAGFDAGAHSFADCTGELGPGESTTITVTVTVNGGTGVTLRVLADPRDPNEDLEEVNDFQPRPPDAAVTFGNNLVIKFFPVQ